MLALAVAGGLVAQSGPGRVPSASAAACGSAGVTITRLSSPILYIDAGVTPNLTGVYAGYAVTNSTGSAFSDLWITLGSFSGPTIGLAPNEDGLLHVGPLANGASTSTYFYLAASGATASAETHTLSLYPGRPDLAAGATCTQSFSVTAEETIKASANKVTSVVSGPTPPELGGLVTITVTGDTKGDRASASS